MRLFKGKRKPDSGNDATAQKIATNIMEKQRSIAEYLNAKAVNIPAKIMRLILIGFCTLFGGYCIYLLIGAIN